MEQLLIFLFEMAAAVMVAYLLCIMALTAIFVAKSPQKHDLMQAFKSSAVLPLAALIMFILAVGLKYAFGICA